MSKNLNEKLTDCSKHNTSFFCGNKVTIEKAFPMIASLSGRVIERGYRLGGGSGERILTEKNFPRAINCGDPTCYGGGVDLEQILRNMVSSRRASFSSKEMCCGHEGSPKGRRTYGRCRTDFEIKINVVYKEDYKENHSSTSGPTSVWRASHAPSP